MLRNVLEVFTALKSINYLLNSMHCTGFLGGAHWGGRGGGGRGVRNPSSDFSEVGRLWEALIFTGLSLLGTPQLHPGLRVGHISPALRADGRVLQNLRYILNHASRTDKIKKKIFLKCKEIRRDRVQSHTWLTASSYMVTYLRISSYMKKPFLIYDFAPDPIWIPLYMMKI